MGLVPGSLDGALVTNDFPLFNLRRERLDPAFLDWLCRTAGFVELCLRASEGTTNRVRLKEERFLGLAIPLPPLAEQRRVVARIEELAAQIHEARTLRLQAAEETGALPTTEISRILEDLLKGELHPINTLGSGGENPIQIGPFGAQLHKTEFVEEGVPVLNVGNVWPDGLKVDHVDHVTKENVELPVPPLPEQRRIVAELDALQAQVDALKRLQAETAAELDALLPAILDRAFKGEL